LSGWLGVRARGGGVLIFGAASGRGLRPLPAESGRGWRIFTGAVPTEREGAVPAGIDGAGETDMVDDGAGEYAGERLGAGELRAEQGGMLGFGGLLRMAPSRLGGTLSSTILFGLGVPSAGPALSFLAGEPSVLGVLSGAGRLGGGMVPSTTAMLEALAPPPVKLSRNDGCDAGAPSKTFFGPLGWVRILFFSLNTNLP